MIINKIKNRFFLDDNDKFFINFASKLKKIKSNNLILIEAPIDDTFFLIKKQFLIFPDINLISKKRFFSTPPPSIEGLKNIKFFSFSWLVNVIF